MPRDASVPIAVVDDDPAQLRLLTNALERAGYAPIPCPDGAAALAQADACRLMLLDVRLPDMSGLEVLARLRETHPALPIVLLTAYIDVRDAVAAIKNGALDYIEKPVDLDELIAAVDDAVGEPGRSTSASGEVSLPKGVVAESSGMAGVFHQVARVAPEDAAVLLLGESGVGKEIVAAAIHEQSNRAGRPFVRVDCGALPESLIESELFGHEKGAFTGASVARKGRFEEAGGGTLFLDEVGELPLPLQPALLGVLETGQFRPVGAERVRHCDVRLIAATNRDLEREAAEGRFRQDLFYRLNVFPIVIPPLRERKEDILPLAELFLHEPRKKLSPAAERILMSYDWPGNVRELRNVLARAAIMANGATILPADLPPALQHQPAASGNDGSSGREGVLIGDMEAIQRQAILEALEKTGGNKTRAAELLGISRRNLIYKLRAYGM